MKKIVIFLIVVLAGNFFFLKKMKSPSSTQSEEGIFDKISNTIQKVTESNSDSPKSNKKVNRNNQEEKASFYNLAVQDLGLLINEKSNIEYKTDEKELELKQYIQNIEHSHRNKKVKIENYKNDIECMTGPSFRSCVISSSRMLMKNGFPDHTGSEKSRNEQAKFLNEEISTLKSEIESDTKFISEKRKDINDKKIVIQKFNENLEKWKKDLVKYKADKRSIIDLHLEWVEMAMKISSSSNLAKVLIKKTCDIESGLYGCDKTTITSDDEIWQFIELN